MTKINPIADSAGIIDQKKINKPDTGGFESTLKTAVSKRAANGLSNSTVSGSQVSGLGEVRAAGIRTTSALTDGIAVETDRLLGLLDTYANDLANPTKTLRELAPMVAELKEKAGLVMAAAKEQVAPGDALGQIAAKAAFTANIEYIKFQRGDYI